MSSVILTLQTHLNTPTSVMSILHTHLNITTSVISTLQTHLDITTSINSCIYSLFVHTYILRVHIVSICVIWMCMNMCIHSYEACYHLNTANSTHLHTPTAITIPQTISFQDHQLHEKKSPGYSMCVYVRVYSRV